MPDVGVVGLVPDLWNAPFQPRHQVLWRLARYFQVVWVEPPRSWRESGGPVRHRFEAVPDMPPGLCRYVHPSWLPLLYRPRFLASFLDRRRLGTIAARLRARGATRIALYIWRPDFASALDNVAHDTSLYHVDDEYSFSDEETPLSAPEEKLLRSCDQVIVHSPALREKKGGINPNTALITNGVDFASFSAPAPEPADLARVPRPRVGYVGYIKRQLDFDVLHAVAHRHPGFSFVLVGPIGNIADCRGSFERFTALENVHLLGGKPVGELPAYTQHFDVCTMCYRVNAYTNCIYPLKLHEYLATGRPVVGTPIRSLQDFEGDIFLARTAEEWSDALVAALDPAEAAPQRVEARRAVARQFDWEILVERIARLICERLGPEAKERFDSAISSQAMSAGATA